MSLAAKRIHSGTKDFEEAEARTPQSSKDMVIRDLEPASNSEIASCFSDLVSHFASLPQTEDPRSSTSRPRSLAVSFGCLRYAMFPLALSGQDIDGLAFNRGKEESR